MKNAKIRKMTGIAIFMAIAAILQVISMFVHFGPFSITLALIPIVIAAIIYGPIAGAIVGLSMGIVTLFDAAAFMAVNVFATLATCLVKATMAGLVAGLIYKVFRKKSFYLAVILASISAPIVNTGLFSLACIYIFKDLIMGWASGTDGYEAATYIKYIFFVILGANFILEFAINTVLSPVVVRVIRVYNKDFGSKEEKVIVK